MLLAIFVAVFCCFFVSYELFRKFRPRFFDCKFDSQNLALKFLQKSDKLWCVVLLNDEASLVCSDGFREFMRKNGVTCKKLNLQDISAVFHNDSFQKGMQHIMHFGGSFVCDLCVSEMHYEIEGTFIENNCADPVFLQREKVKFLKNQPILNVLNGGILMTISDCSKQDELENAFGRSRQKERSLTALLNALPVSVWIKNAQGVITFCNTTYATLLGTQPHHVISRRWNLLSCLDKQSSFKVVHPLPHDESDEVVEVWKLKNKSVFLQVQEFPYKSAADALIIGMATDISQFQKRLEMNQTDLNICLSIFFKLWLPCLLIKNTGQVCFMNQAFIHLFAVPPSFDGNCDDLIDLLYEARQLPEYLNCETLKSMFGKWVNETNSNHHDEVWYRADGSVLNVKVQSLETDYAIITFEDVTKLLSIEQKYKSLISVFNEMVEQSSEAMMVLSTDQKIKCFNQSVIECFGCDEHSLLGRPFYQWLGEYDTSEDEWKKQLMEILENRKAAYMILPLAKGMRLEYRPLSNGWHLLFFLRQSVPIVECLSPKIARI